MNFSELIQWMEASRLHDILNESIWMIPVLQAIHLTAIAILGGSALYLDLRLLGLGLRSPSVRAVDLNTRVTWIGGFVLAFFSGTILFLSEPTRMSESGAFLLKMVLLIIAVALSVWLRSRNSDQANRITKIAALTSLVAWLAVAAAGRWAGLTN